MKALDKIAYDVAGLYNLTARAKDDAIYEYTLEAFVLKELMEKAYKMGIEKGKRLIISEFNKWNNFNS